MTKGCYTCRRRRIICDNGLPTCRKCRDAGKECLGYQKPLVWVKGGVASRGKMMGRSFDDIETNPGVKDTASNTTMGSSQGSSKDSLAPTTEIILTAASRDSLTPGVPRNAGSCLLPTTAFLDESSGFFDSEEVAVELPDIPSAYHQPNYTPAPRSLIDPLFKDFSPLSRFYLSHYSQSVVGIFALYPNVKNPYLDLITLIGESPVLAYSLTATGAVHYALVANGDLPSLPWTPSNNPSPAGRSLLQSDFDSVVANVISRKPVSQVYEHFLSLKHRALRQLSQDLRDPLLQNDDRTVAAILVLAVLDAFESGSGAWKCHLEGAKKLLKNRQQIGHHRSLIDGLDTFVTDGCLLLEIMGSTLARPGALSKPFYSASTGPMLRRLEETSWVGCPAYLLEVIFFVHTQWYSDSEDSLHVRPTFVFSSSFAPAGAASLKSPRALLDHIKAFEPIPWAEGMQHCLYLADLSPRIALAAAYKAAVYLYVSRVFTSAYCGIGFALPADHALIANELVYHLTAIGETDPHFKGLIWPTFIAGAECRHPSHRAIVLQRLNALYRAMSSVNVNNAAWVLSIMWQKQDSQRHHHLPASPDSPVSTISSSSTSAFLDDFNWIQELGDSRIDWLFI
ncbi:hypothetical protein ASPZODRAFT_135084 [Penicilliopsis zonata CBS 506.65]|uniref:Zn(2)-C6 fungal-type domain-containing protein n=1 Tax=Penicilliopsis zonata CBS 506.65 TaxID=1073090 RepID=A0A1L9SAS0_9EURO|nr:hypothetical protein ASPZODRAFT_135084 [Penicilliopsis zonata CBS 506.65]OJJ44282.1 hypothetical protein ASPZODRAFT_135084 [Penicilliopsis zonata CBS 506.65]